jgi:hypothetical protein
MTVKELRKLLRGVDDKMEVFLMEKRTLDIFSFQKTSYVDSGVMDFGTPNDATGEFEQDNQGFIITPDELKDEGDNANINLN